MLSKEISTSIAKVLDKYVLNIFLPLLSKISITDLCVVPDNIIALYPFLLTQTLVIFPSISFSFFSQILFAPEIKYNFCFSFSAIIK